MARLLDLKKWSWSSGGIEECLTWEQELVWQTIEGKKQMHVVLTLSTFQISWNITFMRLIDATFQME